MTVDDAHAATHLRALAEATPDALVTIDAESRVQYVSPAIEGILGYAPDELRGEPLTVLMSSDLGRRHREAVTRYLDTGSRQVDWSGVELPGRHADGRTVPLEISFSEFTADGEPHFAGVVRDVSERKRRAARIARLNERWREFAEVETHEEACALAVAAAVDALGLPIAAVWRYAAESGTLEPCARSPSVEELVGDGSLFPAERGLPWEAFARSEPLTYGDLATESDVDATETPLASAILVPLGSHGVFLAGATATDAFSETEAALVRTLAGNLESVFDRLDREITLRDRTGELEAKNAELARLQRINREIRGIARALLDADSSAEVKQLVCEGLAGSEPYRFVWFGDLELATDEIVPVAWAGVEDGYLDAVSVTADGSDTGRGPAGRAVRERAPQVQNDLQADPPFEPWRQEAVDRGYRSGIAVPVVYGGTLYGLVNLYATEAGVFTEKEEDVLAELGEVIGYALNAMERYDALVGEDAVELEFAVRDDDDPLLSFLRENEASFRIEDVGHRKGGLVHVFATIEGATYEQISAFVDRYGGTGGLSLVRERGSEIVVELPLTETSTTATLLDRGAFPTDIRGTPGEGRFSIRIPRSASVRRFLELLEERYADVELVARRTTAEAVASRGEFERAYLDALTDRQLEILRTAYFAGYFEQPRTSTARDVAELLGVTQPTVSRHVRAGEETLFSMLFGEPDDR